MYPGAFADGRRFLAPEIVQTSAMDCGPAALKCLLEGFGIPVSYGRLREACQTDVDGTSIDTLEEVAWQLGLDSAQTMMPADHLFLSESQSLPALVVTRLPDGAAHFVVVWGLHGRWVQVMDPNTGRRWLSQRRLLGEIYIHEQPVDQVADHQPPSAAIQQADLLDELERLPDGLRTVLGEEGGLVSGGEGQRVRLGRSILRPGIRLVVLDEAFRGLDRNRRGTLLLQAREHWA